MAVLLVVILASGVLPSLPRPFEIDEAAAESANIESPLTEACCDEAIEKFDADISDDGRYLVFSSADSGLPGYNGFTQVYRYDTDTEDVLLISDAGSETGGDHRSYEPHISADGSVVAFGSRASDLVSGDTNGVLDVFAATINGSSVAVERVSVASDGTEGDDWSYWLDGGAGLTFRNQIALSGNGDRVVFWSGANNLVDVSPSTTTYQLFMHDRSTAETYLVSEDTGGGYANNTSAYPTITDDGNLIAFQSASSDLIPDGGSSGTWQVFTADVSDIENGPAIERVSLVSGVAANGENTEDGNAHSQMPSISGNGLQVAFVSLATNLTTDSTDNQEYDVFVRDLEDDTTILVTDATRLHDSNCLDMTGFSTATRSPDFDNAGRFLTFITTCRLFEGDTEYAQKVYLYDRSSGTIVQASTNTSGGSLAGTSNMAAISGSGDVVAFTSNGNAQEDLFYIGRNALEYVDCSRDCNGPDPDNPDCCEPVNAATGNFHDGRTDFEPLGGAYGLEWRRYYNSADATVGDLGRGWSHTYMRRAASLGTAGASDVEVIDWDGRVHLFEWNTTDWDAPEGMHAELSYSNGEYTLTYATGESWQFDSSGRIEVLDDGRGQSTTVTWASGLLDKAVSTTGAQMDFTYTGSRITEVQAGMVVDSTFEADRKVTYTYSTPNTRMTAATEARELAATDWMIETYGYAGQMIDEIHYTYEGSTDPARLLVENVYTSGRVTKQTMGSGEVVTLDYDLWSGETTVKIATTAAPTTYYSTTTYSSDPQGRLTGVEDPYGEVLSREYSTEGMLEQFNDRSGASYATDYDSYGRLASREWPNPETGELADAEAEPPEVPVLETWQYWDEKSGTGAPAGDPRVWKHTDRMGNVTTFEYDQHQAPVDTTPWSGGPTNDVDDLVPSRVIDPLNHVTTYWSSDGLVMKVQEPGTDGVITENRYGDDAFCTVEALPRTVCATVVDPAGKNLITRFEYENDAGVPLSTGRLIKTTTPEGAVTTRDYDDRGRLVKVTDPEAAVSPSDDHYPVEYRYDDYGRLAFISDESNSTAGGSLDTSNASEYITYLSDGRVDTRVVNDTTAITVEDNDYSTNSTGKVHTVKAPEVDDTGSDTGRPTTTHQYSALGRLQSITEPLFYDSGSTSVKSRETFFCYDEAGHQIVSKTGDAPILAIEKECTALGLLDDDDVTRTYYDKLGRVIEVRQPADPSGNRPTTRTDYDDAGRADIIRTGYTNSSGTWVEVSYTETDFDAAGRAQYSKGKIGDPNDPYEGILTERTYTDAGRLKTTITPVPGSDQDFVWSTGAKYTIENFYDTAGRLETIKADDPDGTGTLDTTYVMDKDGRHTQVTYPDGTVVGFAYDDLGRLLTETRKGTTPGTTTDDLEQHSTWTSTGQMETQTDWHAPTTSTPPQRSYTYNKRGLLTEVVDQNEVLVCYSYDERGNRVLRRSWQDYVGTYDCATTTDAIDETWGWSLSDQLLEARNPDGDSTATDANDLLYTYYTETNLPKTITDGSGRVTTNAYDDLGRVTQRQHTGTGLTTITNTYTHDFAGRVTQVDDLRPNNTIDYTYDLAGNVLTHKAPTPDDDGQNTTTWTYDLGGRKSTILFADGRKLRWRYDKAGRIENVDGDFYHWLPLVERTYDTMGRPTREQRSDGSYKTWGYDTQGRLDDYRTVDEYQIRHTELGYHESGRLKAEQTWKDGVLTDDLDYRYDNARQLIGVDVTTGDHPELDWTYDDHGNRKTETRDAVVTSYDYNNADQLNWRKITSDRQWTYTWDDAGRRTEWLLEDISGIEPDELKKHTTIYDAAGKPSDRTGTDDPDESEGSATTLYDWDLVYDGNNQLAEAADTLGGTTLATTWDPATAQQLVTILDNNLFDNVIFNRTNGFDLVRGDGLAGHTDYMGSQLSHRWDWNAAERWEPFGTSDVQRTAQWAYRGELEIAGELYLRNRDYDPQTGTFTTPDPADGINGTTTVANSYHYTDNDPLNKVDPLGLAPVNPYDPDEGDNDLELSRHMPVWIAPYSSAAADSERTFNLPTRPGLGLIRINLFIAAPSVHISRDLPGPFNIEGGWHEGNDRSWGPYSPAQHSKGAFELDFRSGIGRVFVSHTCKLDHEKCWDARPIELYNNLGRSSIALSSNNRILSDFRDNTYTLQWSLVNAGQFDNENGLAAGFGCAIDGEMNIDATQPGGVFSWDHDAFPSVEAYQYFEVSGPTLSGAGGVQHRTLRQVPESGNANDLCRDEL